MPFGWQGRGFVLFLNVNVPSAESRGAVFQRRRGVRVATSASLPPLHSGTLCCPEAATLQFVKVIPEIFKAFVFF